MLLSRELLQSFQSLETHAWIFIVDHGIDQGFFHHFVGRLLGKNLNCPKSGSRIVRVSQCAEQQPANGIILQASLEPQRLEIRLPVLSRR